MSRKTPDKPVRLFPGVPAVTRPSSISGTDGTMQSRAWVCSHRAKISRIVLPDADGMAMRITSTSCLAASGAISCVVPKTGKP